MGTERYTKNWDGKIAKGAKIDMVKIKCMASIVLALKIALFVLVPVTVFANEINVIIDGQQVNFDGQRPTVIDGRTLVPVRGVFETLGFDVEWNPYTQAATLTNSDYVVVVTIGNAVFTTNGVGYILDVPAQIIGGSTMLPIRAVLESVGYYVDWNADTHTVIIKRAYSYGIMLPALSEQEQLAPIKINLSAAEIHKLNDFFILFAGRLGIGMDLPNYDIIENTSESIDIAVTFVLGRVLWGFWGREVSGFVNVDSADGYNFISASDIDSLVLKFFAISDIYHRSISGFQYRDGRYYVPLANGGTSSVELNVIEFYDNRNGTFSAMMAIDSYSMGEFTSRHYTIAIIQPFENSYQILYWRNNAGRNATFPVRQPL